MKKRTTWRWGRGVSTILFASVLLGGCAIQTPPAEVKEAPQSQAEQRNAQQVVTTAVPAKPLLKRKIALGRITNETNFGRSLLRDQHGDPLGKQVTDLLSKALTESGAYLVFERPDISRIKDEARLTGESLNLVGVDALIIGSLTEFGRKCQRRLNSDPPCGGNVGVNLTHPTPVRFSSSMPCRAGPAPLGACLSVASSRP